ncbi:hypothetical protein GMORB2_6125 [Geosmithia morbida]|uniref:Uncharacterized protein n=1 Tax=Geosmithia morbida TaxID=1094350 RepID=A0A9P5D6E4_9HYPO|nr:uncharacterized protein GMORB2_6125 [Geosmithia morbida]KAF4123424.1 hypothetical protein GMORB2_6125 [Geosmithia morbida]
MRSLLLFSGSMAPHQAATALEPESSAFYESLRWLDESNDLDLSLGFGNLAQDVGSRSVGVGAGKMPSSPDGGGRSSRRTPNRRRLSLGNKFPLSRPSVGSRPGTKDTATAAGDGGGGGVAAIIGTTTTITASPPPLKRSPSQMLLRTSGNGRRMSRALSLASAKQPQLQTHHQQQQQQQQQHARQVSTPIDAVATHYQDPGARLTLREYVTSPTKFDEALEYGFPSLTAEAEAKTAGGIKDVKKPAPLVPNLARSDGNEDNNDNDNKNNSSKNNNNNNDNNNDNDDDDDGSSTHSTVSDSDSPKTPPAAHSKPMVSPRLCADPELSSSSSPPPPAGAVKRLHSPGQCREMTVRMTLTRPDLRAYGDDVLYAWQDQDQNRNRNRNRQNHRQPPQTEAPAARKSILSVADRPRVPSTVHGGSEDLDFGNIKESMEKRFDAFDQEMMKEDATDGGVVKRIWKKVLRV